MKSSTLLKLFSFAFLLFPLLADALEFPHTKPGLWEMRIQNSTDGPAPSDSTSRMCLDEKSIKEAEELSKKDCSKYELHKEGGKWILNSVCKFGTMTVSSHVTTEYQGENSSHVVGDATFNPPLMGYSRAHTVVDNKWLGPCK